MSLTEGGGVFPGGVGQSDDHLWRHLRSYRHALERTLNPSVSPTELDKERILALADYFRLSRDLRDHPDNISLQGESIDSGLTELVFSSHVRLLEVLDRSQEFAAWRRDSKVSARNLVRKLVTDLEGLAADIASKDRMAHLRPEEIAVLQSALQTLVEQTEPALA